MITYRMNAVMGGSLYLLGTVFGVSGGIVGGEVLASIISGKPIAGVDMLSLVAVHSPRLTGGAFLTLMMGISLMAMTVFLYPVIRKNSEEFALGVLLFRGALEGTGYLLSTLGISTLIILSLEYVATGANSTALQSVGNVLVQLLNMKGAFTSIVFLVGATCLYIAFYRTRLIPRWLTVWGLIGVVPYLAYALLHIFHIDNGIGFYLQMVLAPQELVMGLWLIIKGFNQEAVKKLDDRELSR